MFVNNLYDKTYEWLFSIWSGKSNLREIKDTYLSSLHMLQATGAKLLVIDLRQLEYNVQADQMVDWMRQVWQPEAQRCGLETLIHIVPSTPSDGDEWPFVLETALGIPQFESVEQSIKWLQIQRSQNPAWM